ncbi:iron complex transport system permease protein [Desulfurella multipotens]|jgi:iron complex transport system permease protein|uniref:Iron complex transport system permease protein n=1 Tax=Desulfurella multipotens TaxID=79269 RepID=A0A1G6I3K2_9BACT|nr:iron ABC transporter permease [Desulfurella multipotens]SDC01122.1 iron complex transport system permease protein [Desulfurella multipotens]
MKRKEVYLIVLVALLVMAFFWSLGLGDVHISTKKIIEIFENQMFNTHNKVSFTDKYVLLNLRLPRILSAMLVGASLSLCGVIFQAVLLNPLADSYTLGAASGAAFGATLAFILNLFYISAFSVSLFAFFGAVLSLVIVLYVAGFKSNLSSINLIISGIIVATIFSSAIALLDYLASKDVAYIMFWLMGSFDSSNWHNIRILFLVLTIVWFFAFFWADELDIISLNELSAQSLGVNVVKIRFIALILATLLTAVCVSSSGIIGFIGLIVPHIVRFIIGPKNRLLSIYSVLLGALLLLIADTFSRSFSFQIPIGVLTGLIGGPFFLYIYKIKVKKFV